MALKNINFNTFLIIFIFCLIVHLNHCILIGIVK
ncbi:hypothetical protein BCE_2666 [Bacillus cereus ATCC 10987]|uniref:Uncharacterized protein n=1 Tax=Bacillus cereus (strain ATCC 10987 / NRS 248) TaxID=222523 RepID=Q737I2_BACC1|nr:hypothetical protein BCE_2666 [Bacillus cereus ATCC 10987]